MPKNSASASTRFRSSRTPIWTRSSPSRPPDGACNSSASWTCACVTSPRRTRTSPNCCPARPVAVGSTVDSRLGTTAMELRGSAGDRAAKVLDGTVSESRRCSVRRQCSARRQHLPARRLPPRREQRQSSLCALTSLRRTAGDMAGSRVHGDNGDFRESPDGPPNPNCSPIQPVRSGFPVSAADVTVDGRALRHADTPELPLRGEVVLLLGLSGSSGVSLGACWAS